MARLRLDIIFVARDPGKFRSTWKVDIHLTILLCRLQGLIIKQTKIKLIFSQKYHEFLIFFL